MGSAAQPDLELKIRRLADDARWEDAATCAIKGYGAELLGFLHSAPGNTASRETSRTIVGGRDVAT